MLGPLHPDTKVRCTGDDDLLSISMKVTISLGVLVITLLWRLRKFELSHYSTLFRQSCELSENAVTC